MTKAKPKPAIIWEAPPDGPSRRNKYSDLVAEMKKSPGRWAQVRIAETQSGAYGSRKAAVRATAGDERYEFIVRPVDNPGGWGVWGRYRTEEQMGE